jgi:hypothetical protein
MKSQDREVVGVENRVGRAAIARPFTSEWHDMNGKLGLSGISLFFNRDPLRVRWWKRRRFSQHNRYRRFQRRAAGRCRHQYRSNANAE